MNASIQEICTWCATCIRCSVAKPSESGNLHPNFAGGLFRTRKMQSIAVPSLAGSHLLAARTLQLIARQINAAALARHAKEHAPRPSLRGWFALSNRGCPAVWALPDRGHARYKTFFVSRCASLLVTRFESGLVLAGK